MFPDSCFDPAYASVQSRNVILGNPMGVLRAKDAVSCNFVGFRSALRTNNKRVGEDG